MPKNDRNPVKSKHDLKQELESLQETGNFNIQNWKPIAYSPDLQVTRPVVGYPQIPKHDFVALQVPQGRHWG
jgi:hypothetical protein